MQGAAPSPGMLLQVMLGPEMSEDMSQFLDLRYFVSPSVIETSTSRNCCSSSGLLKVLLADE